MPSNTFLSLLRSGLYGTPIPEAELPDHIDWEAILRLSKKHVVTGIIIDSIQYLPEHLRPTGKIALKMNKFALGLIQANLILDKTIARLVTTLADNGIRGVLLKGQGVARYYRQPQMRQTGDIDFYVGKGQYDKAVAVCTSELASDKDKVHASKKHFNFTMNGVEVELHRMAAIIYSPFKNRRFQQWIIKELEDPRNLRTLRLGDTDVYLPSYDFDALYIFYHAWFHFIFGGIGLRQLCDWAMIFQTHADDIDKDTLIRNLASFGLIDAWKFFAGIAVNYIGVSPEKMPLYDINYLVMSERVMQEILKGGNFGYSIKANADFKTANHDLRAELRKLKAITGNFASFFPIIPIEATLLYLSRLYDGSIAVIKRIKSKI